MKQKPRILIFPGGTEIGLTIYDSLRHMAGVEVFGGSSVDDHARFAFKEKHIPDMVDVYHPGFITDIKVVCEQYGIDYIYPAHDDVLYQLVKHPQEIPAEVIAPDFETVEICRYKSLTYRLFPEISPHVYAHNEMPTEYPAFVKPDAGQGSRGAHKVEDSQQWAMLNREPGNITMEYLPGREWTVDCFTDRHGELLFCEARTRTRIKNGIAVRTERCLDFNCWEYAQQISEKLEMRGQWFFQVKEDATGYPALLEIAPRPAGSSVLWTAHGVWLPQLTVRDRLGEDVEIGFLERRVEMDRALGYRFCYH